MKWLWLLVGLLWSSASVAADKPLYGPAPAWVAPPPQESTTAPQGAPFHILVAESQVRFGDQADESYSHLKVKVLTADGLSVGNVNLGWNPATDELKIHGLKIERAGRAIDVLRSQQFTVLRREERLEDGMLDGSLTAALQVQGLQVGDVLDLRYTLVRKPYGGKSEGELSLPPVGVAGSYRARAIWPKSKPLRWAATTDLGAVRPVEAGDSLMVEHMVMDPKTAAVVEGAPDRFNRFRTLEFSGFGSWAEVAGLMAASFEKAATVAPGSFVREEARKIAGLSADPATRAAAALRLVQEQIRYVYIGLNEGAYTPVSADETWKRRYGDCKAKTALLLALLKELGIEAEPALVSTEEGDGLDTRLPRLGYFDHVLVRARIDAQTYWLDGTRTGDRELAELPVPLYHWALPVRTAGAVLERLEPKALTLAESSLLLEIDASRGMKTPAPVKGEQVLRGDEAVQLAANIKAMAAEDAVRALKEYWIELHDWIEPKTVSWRFDEVRRTVFLLMAGEGRLDWTEPDGSEELGYVAIRNATFGRPAEVRRPSDQDQTVPFAVAFPSYRRWVTVIRLPIGDGRLYDYQGVDEDETFGGYSYRRDTTVRDGVLVTRVSIRALKPEITAAEAAAIREARKALDTGSFSVYSSPPAQTLAERLAEVERAAGSDPAKLVEVGREYLRARSPEKARAVFDRALKAKPGDVDALLGKVSAMVALADRNGALALLEAAARHNPDRQLLRRQAGLLTADGRPAEAITALKAILTRHPDDEDAAWDLAYDLFNQGEVDDAIRVLAPFESKAGVKVQIGRFRAHSATRQGRRDEAINLLHETVRLEPDNPINLRNRARWFTEAGQHERALADLEEAHRMDPMDLEVIKERAEVFAAMGRPVDAIAALDDGVARYRSSAQSLNNRCWVRALIGRQLAEAEADCQAALKLRPDTPNILGSYALVALRAGRFDEAVKRYDRSLEKGPKRATALYGRGLAKLRLGDENGGQADLAAAKAINARVSGEYDRHGIKPGDREAPR